MARQKAIVKDIVGKHGGIVVGKGPGELYDQKKFDTPYIRDFLLDRGAVGDVSETAAPWSKLLPLYTNVIAAAREGLRPARRHGLDHVPPFALLPLRRVPVLHLRVQARRRRPAGSVRATQERHPAGVRGLRTGRCRTITLSAPSTRAWLEQDISAPGVHMIDGLFTAMDPGRNFNPGKIVSK